MFTPFNWVIERYLASKEQPPVTMTGAGVMLALQTSNRVDPAEILRIYAKSGIVPQVIDIYADHITRSGWLIETDEDQTDLAAEIASRLEEMEINSWIHYVVRQALIFGYGVCEIVKDTQGAPVRILKRKSEQFGCTFDRFGQLEGYYQSVGGFQKTPVDTDRLLWLTAIDSFDLYGTSLVYRAKAEIEHDGTISEGIALAIKRHGTGKHWHKLGTPEKPMPPDQVQAYRSQMDKYQFKSEIITSHQVEITEIDRATMDVTPYADYSMARLCSAMGIPQELLGFRQGSTDNTAVSRIRSFYDRIGAMQNTISTQITAQLVSQIMPDDGRYAVFRFNSASVAEWSEKAKTITELMKANPMNPFWLGEAWIKGELGIPIDDLGDYGG